MAPANRLAIDVDRLSVPPDGQGLHGDFILAGYSKGIGIIGALSWIGWIVLALLPDQSERDRTPASEEGGRAILAKAVRHELTGEVVAAVKLYRTVMRELPGTESARDAKASVLSLQSKLGSEL